MMTVVTEQTSLQNTVKAKAVLALATCLPVIMETVCLEYIFAMAIMTAWITVMKIAGTNAVRIFHTLATSFLLILLFQMTVSVMKRLNSLAKRTNSGVARSVYQENGYVTVTQIVSMELTKTQLYTIALRHNLVVTISLRVLMADVLIK